MEGGSMGENIVSRKSEERSEGAEHPCKLVVTEYGENKRGGGAPAFGSSMGRARGSPVATAATPPAECEQTDIVARHKVLLLLPSGLQDDCRADAVISGVTTDEREEPTDKGSETTEELGNDAVSCSTGKSNDTLYINEQMRFPKAGGVLEGFKDRRDVENSGRSEEDAARRKRSRLGSTAKSSNWLLRADNPEPVDHVEGLEAFGAGGRSDLDQQETPSSTTTSVAPMIDGFSNEGHLVFPPDDAAARKGESVCDGSVDGKRDQEKSEEEPCDGGPRRNDEPAGGTRQAGDVSGDDAADHRQEKQGQEQPSRRRQDEEEGDGEGKNEGEGEPGDGKGGGAKSKASSGSDFTLGLRVAIVRHGITRKRSQVFRQRAAEIGIEARDWPPPQEVKAPNPMDLMPGVVARLSPPQGPSKAKGYSCAGGSVGYTIRGKGKKRLLNGERRERMSAYLPPGDANTSTTAVPRPLAPVRTTTAASAAREESNPYDKHESISNDYHHLHGGNRGGVRELGTSGVGRANGRVWPVERVCREGFTHMVCAPSSASRRALWDELLRLLESGRSSADGAGRGEGSRASEGGAVEVVDVDWLVSCLREKRRVPTEPYLLAPPPPSNNEEGGDVADDRGRLVEKNRQEQQQARSSTLKVAKYACQRPTPMNHHNKHITDVLDATSKLYIAIGDKERGDSYQRASSVLKSLPRRIRSVNEVAHAHHVGKQLAKNIEEIIETGTLQRLEELRQIDLRRQNPKNTVCLELTKVHGVGPKIALEWYNAGIRSVEDARTRLDAQGEGNKLPSLKSETVAGLRYFHDLQFCEDETLKGRINTTSDSIDVSWVVWESCWLREYNPIHQVPIEREEIVSIVKDVRQEAERLGQELDPAGEVLFEVCGGYRRGKERCHDVDVLVSFRRGNGQSGHVNLVEDLKQRLVGSGKLIVTLFHGRMSGFGERTNAIVPASEREEVLMGLWQLPSRKCRIDIVQVPWPQWPFAVLGWSGTVMFERDLRTYAKGEMNLKFSQNGLFFEDSGLRVPETFTTEEDIFRRLELEYIPPHLRWA